MSRLKINDGRYLGALPVCFEKLLYSEGMDGCVFHPRESGGRIVDRGS